MAYGIIWYICAFGICGHCGHVRVHRSSWVGVGAGQGVSLKATAAEAACVVSAVFCSGNKKEISSSYVSRKGGNMGCLRRRRRRQQRTPSLSVRMESLSHLCSAAELKKIC